MLHFDAEQLMSMLADLHTMTRIHFVFYDAQGHALLSYPTRRRDFCAAVRSTPVGEARCLECDRRAFRLNRDIREPMIYRCHAGLTEAVVPLKENDVLLGYLMFGQVRCGADAADVLAATSDLGLDPALLMPLVQAVPVKTDAEIDACATILKLMTAYLRSANLVSLPREAFLERLDRYLDAHLEESIRVEDLCRHFHVSRSAFYQQTMEKLGCGPAAYVLRHRIRAACRLLSETDLSVGEIAARTGFTDQNSFCRAFRRETGVTARAWRAAAEKKET